MDLSTKHYLHGDNMKTKRIRPNYEQSTRNFLALVIPSYFFVMILVVLGGGAYGSLEMTEAIEIVSIVSPILTGLIGYIAGYYFGTKVENNT